MKAAFPIHLDVKQVLINWRPQQWKACARTFSGKPISPDDLRQFLYDSLVRGNVDLLLYESDHVILDDPWIDLIEKWLSQQPNFTALTLTTQLVLTSALGEEITHGSQMRAGKCLRRMGYKRRQIRQGKKLEWIYRKWEV